MTAEQRPVVDDLGNIAVHGRSGLVLVVKIETATAGVYEDISASDLFFEIGGKLRLALSAGADIYSRQVILTRAQIATLSINQPYAFAIHDETPSTPSTPWTGTITTFGFKAAPTGVPDVDGEAANWTGATVVIQPGGGSPVVVVNYMGQPGVGIPTGGTTGQYLRKSSSTDYATGWDTLTADDVSGLSSTLSTLTSADVSLTTRLSTEETTRASADTSLATAAAATYLPLAGGVMTGALAAVAGTAALPGLAVAGDLDTGIYGVSANVLGVSAGGLNAASFSNGQLSLATAAGGAGVNLAVDAVNVLALRNGTNANTLRVYQTYGGAGVDYERVFMRGAGSLFEIGTEAGGSGTVKPLYFSVGGSTAFYFSTGRHLLAGVDNTYDFGAAGATRARSGYFGTNVVIGNTSTSTAQLHVGAGAIMTVANGGGSNISPQAINAQTSGTAVIGVGVNDGTNNRRAGLFVNQTDGLWGLASNVTTGAIPFILFNNGAEQLRLNTSGQLGIGENNPSYLLDAKATSSGATVAGARLNNNGTGANTRVSLTFQAAGTLYQSIIGGYGAASPEMQFNQLVGSTGFWTWNSSGTEVMRLTGAGALTATGNIRAQTTSAAAYLDVATTTADNAYLRFITSNTARFVLGADASDGKLKIGTNNTFATTLLDLSNTGVATLYNNVLAAVDATYDWGASGANRFRDGFLSRNLTVGTGVTAGTFLRVNGTNAGYIALGTADDVLLYRDAANALALRNATNAQTLRAYNTYTDASNYERVSLDWSANIAYLRTQKGGTGADRSIVISATASAYIGGGGSFQWQFSSDGNFYPNADATTDAGGAAKQIRDLYLSRRLMIGGAAPAGASGLATVQGFGTNWSLIGANTLTDATSKNNIIGTLHYLSAQPPVISIYTLSSGSTNTLNFGGGSATGNAATLLNFYTAAGLTTPTGTIRWSMDTSGHFLAGADNTYDIGASGANRPRNLYVGSQILVGSAINWPSSTKINGNSVNGNLVLQNNGGTSFGLLQLGGESNLFPALKRSSAAIHVRLADDSAYADLACASLDTTGRAHILGSTATPAGGTAGIGYRFSSTSNFGVFFGSGAPTLSAAKGSLYLRSDGSGTSDRMYVNTDGATAWTAVTTAT